MKSMMNIYGSVSQGGSQNFSYSEERPMTNATVGSIVFNSKPEPNGIVGWIYSDVGWLGFGPIEGISTKPFTLSDGTQFLVRDDADNGVEFLFREFTT